MNSGTCGSFEAFDIRTFGHGCAPEGPRTPGPPRGCITR